jgi:23S rRNA (pseudouridine1915-N3)-methyltransferase
VRFLVIVVGKVRDRELAGAIAEYEVRAARYWPLEVVEVRDESGRGMSAEQVKEREGARLLERAGAARLVACDAAGQAFTSEKFADWLQRAREEARDVAFLVGGANGLSEEVRRRASTTLSLSSLTFPHEVARLVLAEQLYRAGTIARGEPYHK